MTGTVPAWLQALPSLDLDAWVVPEEGADDFLIANRVVAETGAAEDAVFAALAAHLGMRFERLDAPLAQIDDEAIPYELSDAFGAVCIGREDGVLLVALTDPLDLHPIDMIQVATGFPAEPVVVPPQALREGLETVRSKRTSLGRFLQSGRALPDHPERLREEFGDEAIQDLVDEFLLRAIRVGASDLHLERDHDGFRARARVDGKLRTLHVLPDSIGSAVISRIKVIAGLDLGENRRSQDGQVLDTRKHVGIELRVSILPTVRGESAVIRILDSNRLLTSLDQLDLEPRNYRRLQKAVNSPDGMVLVTGPTGSGKSTTMRAAISERDASVEKLIAIEDPVEFRMPGVTHIQVDLRADRTFANALRAVLRHDPDVVMVGEIRDRDTAETAVRAAMTGHTVFASLHTNDAAGSVSRLLDLGIDPWLLSESLRCVVAQRLLPRLCEECREPRPPSPASIEMLGRAGIELDDLSGFHGASGCSRCGGTGRVGRIGIHEVLEFSPLEVQNLASGTRPVDGGVAANRVLVQDAVDKASRGLIDLADAASYLRA